MSEKWIMIGLILTFIGIMGIVFFAPGWVFFLVLFSTGIFLIQTEFLDD